MEKTQFVYKRTIKIPPVMEEDGTTVKEEGYNKDVLDSFDVDRIIRTMETDDGRRLVLLDDLHERFETKPKVNHKGTIQFNKQGAPIMERVKDAFQSEIYLSEEEGKQLLTLIAINQ